jgi:hypothetical protein
MTLTGVLAALGCFLLGCCGSPMLTVYVAMFGSALVGFQDIFVFGFTLASVLVGFLWLRRCCGAAAACGPDCACHLPGADAEWVVAATDGAQAPVGAGPGGWLSASVQLEADAPADWGSVARAYLELLHGTLRLGGDRQAHVKLLLTTPSGALVANLAGVAGEPVFRGDAGAVAPSASLVVSTRAELAPEALRQVLESTLAEVLGTRFRGRIVRLQSLRANQPGAAGLPA